MTLQPSGCTGGGVRENGTTGSRPWVRWAGVTAGEHGQFQLARHMCTMQLAQHSLQPVHSTTQHTQVHSRGVWVWWVWVGVYVCVRGKGAAVTVGAARAYRAPCSPAHSALVPRAAPGAATHTLHSQLATTADSGRVTAVCLQVLQLECPRVAPLSTVSVPVLEAQGCTAHVACKR